MLRLVLALAFVAVVTLSGCGVIDQVAGRSACSFMTEEDYSEAYRLIRYYAEVLKAGGVSKSEFLDEINSADYCGDLDDHLETYGSPFGTITCDCIVAMYRAAANDVW